MVVEFLTFSVPEGELATWMQVEEQHWSRFLERQPGFVRKQLWSPAGDPGGDGARQVHAVIWWETLEQWQAVPADELAAVAEAMGPHEREATCLAYDVLRDC